jgi:ankyrin repeat protein
MMVAAQAGNAEALSVLARPKPLPAMTLPDLMRWVHPLTEHNNLNATDAYGYSAAMMAAERGHTQALEVLVNAGVDLNLFNSEGDNALMLAAQQGHTEAINAMLRVGHAGNPDIDSRNRRLKGDTALTLAVKAGRPS